MSVGSGTLGKAAVRTGVRKLSATKRALALSYPVLALSSCILAVEPCSCCAYKELHLRNLLIHLLHELYDKVNQLVFQHLLGVKVGNQERDIIALQSLCQHLPSKHLPPPDIFMSIPGPLFSSE